MATFDEHIQQAKRNLSFLHEVNTGIGHCWDWQVTISFYTAVHLVNAHIASKSNHHYRSHERVKEAINPYNITSLSKLPEEEYLAYIKLQNLSRRARYLCHDDPDNHGERAFLTYDKHFSKSVTHLDKLLDFVSKEYGTSFKKTDLKCLELKSKSLSNFSAA